MRVLICAAALACAGQAAAAEASAPVRWSGLHLGVQGGWAQRSGPAGYDMSGGLRRVGEGEKRDMLDGQALAGFDVKGPGRVIVGVEGLAGIGGGTRQNLVNGRTNGATETKWNYAVTARIGTPVGAEGLVYVRAGYAAERVHKTYFGPVILIFPPPQTSSTGWADGSLIGLGGELSVHKHLSLRLEYNRRRLDDGYRGDAVLLGALWRF